ncbi:MAG: transcriptional regulator [Pseudomonadota bacterium]
MIRILIWGLLLYIGYRIIVSLASSKKSAEKPVGKMDSAEITYRDPVCGVYVSEEQAVVGRHDGQKHYFCSMDCLEKYREQLDHIPN